MQHPFTRISRHWRKKADPVSGRHTLNQANIGRPLRLLQLDTNKQLAHRLTELGLTPGVELSVLHNTGGALMISVRGSRVGVCSRTASHLHVEPLL